MSIFEELESEVRSYSRGWPVVFDRAQGSHLYAESGKPDDLLDKYGMRAKNIVSAAERVLARK